MVTQKRALAASGRATSLTAGARSDAVLWLQLCTLVLSVAGLGGSVYLTIAHYSSPTILA
jgi:hypothetical protein